MDFLEYLTPGLDYDFGFPLWFLVPVRSRSNAAASIFAFCCPLSLQFQLWGRFSGVDFHLYNVSMKW